VHIHALRCFGACPGDGNPALVIEGDASPSQARQDFARERDVTCVWIDPASGGGVATLDFYYPHTRSPLCLHATLAAAQILFAHHGTAPLTVRTAMHGQELGLVRADDALFVRLMPQAVTQPTLENGLVARLLCAPEDTLPGIPRVASVGSPKLLVELRTAPDLHALAPDLAAIAAWSKAAGVNGLYAWCRIDDDVFEGRNFNHLDPRLEDSATGVAAGALSVRLGRGLHLLQGRATGRDCLIRTRIEDGAVLVRGRVEAVA
jgi:PhzF family phenazine biosynthesis protein